MSPNYQSLSECNYIAESMPTCSENVLKWLKLGILANQACAQVPCAPKCDHMLNPSQQALRVHWNVTASMNQKQQYLMMWRKLHYTPVTHWSWVQWQVCGCTSAQTVVRSITGGEVATQYNNLLIVTRLKTIRLT